MIAWYVQSNVQLNIEQIALTLRVGLLFKVFNQTKLILIYSANFRFYFFALVSSVFAKPVLLWWNHLLTLWQPVFSGFFGIEYECMDMFIQIKIVLIIIFKLFFSYFQQKLHLLQHWCYGLHNQFENISTKIQLVC